MRDWPPERVLFPRLEEEQRQGCKGHTAWTAVWRQPCDIRTQAATLYLSQAAAPARTARLHSAGAPLLTGCRWCQECRHQTGRAPACQRPHHHHSLPCCGVWGCMKSARVGAPRLRGQYSQRLEGQRSQNSIYPSSHVELEREGWPQETVTGHANCHAEG